jgi:hypothetical protein
MSSSGFHVPDSPAFAVERSFGLADIESDPTGTEFDVGRTALEPVVNGTSRQAEMTCQRVLVDVTGTWSGRFVDLEWCPDQELNLDPRFRKPHFGFREVARLKHEAVDNIGRNARFGKSASRRQNAEMCASSVPLCSIEDFRHGPGSWIGAAWGWRGPIEIGLEAVSAAWRSSFEHCPVQWSEQQVDKSSFETQFC